MSRRPALTLFAIALLARVITVAVALIGHHGSIERYFLQSDAPSYVAVARMIMTAARGANGWHERVFIGWPLMFAVPGALVGYDLACLALGVLCAALVPVAWWTLTQDRASSLALTMLTPTWLMQSGLGMSEPAFLLLQVVAVLAWVRERPLVASACAGAAMVVRPNGAFVWLAVAYGLGRRRAWSRLAAHGALAAASVAVVVLFNLHFYGDALRQAHMYSELPNIGAEASAAVANLPFAGGHMGLPFLHLIATPLIVHVPLWKIIFVWLHALLVLVACGLGIQRMRAYGFARALSPASEPQEHNDAELHAMMLLWALLSTAFILCTGPYWGFHSFDRYCVWALPAYLYLAREHLPKRDALWLALGVVSIAVTLWSQARAF